MKALLHKISLTGIEIALAHWISEKINLNRLEVATKQLTVSYPQPQKLSSKIKKILLH